MSDTNTPNGPEAPNPAQIAPGAEVNGTGIGTPYQGDPLQAYVENLNENLQIGIQAGRY